MMSSAGWETVGLDGRGIKKSGLGVKAVAKKEAQAKKKFAERAPKLEDVLPFNDVASAYSVFDGAKVQQLQNGSKSPKPDPSKQKKPQEKKPEKKDGPKEEPKPKTLEEAAKKINVPHLKHLLATTKANFPDDQLLWIRDAASYLNLTLTYGTSELSPTDFQSFSPKPLSVINKETKRILTLLFEKCDSSVCVTAFETLLANMSHDMAKGHSVHGYLILLQLLSDLNPSLCLLRGSASRFVELRNSYQNRPNIGTALLWVVGLGGEKDLQIGLKVWLEFMLPLLTLRHYSRFIVDYLKNLLKIHNASALGKIAKSQDGSRILYPPQFFVFFDTVFTIGPGALNKEIQADLSAQYPTVKALAVGDCGNDHELFPEFLRRLDSSLSSSGPSGSQASLQKEALNCMEQCIAGPTSEAALSHWRQMYRAHIVPSARLLQHLDSVWDKTLSKKVSRDSKLEDLIEAFDEFNESSSQQKDGIPLATTSAKSLLIKMSRQNNSSGWFPWKSASLLLILSIGYLLHHDVTKHGSYHASNTGRFLQDVGIFNETVEVYTFALYVTEDAKEWAEINVPVYIEKTRIYIGPMVDKVGSSINSGVQFVKTNVPVITDKINEYLPGIKEKLIVFGDSVWHQGEKSVKWIQDHGLEYCQWIVKLVVDYANIVIEWIKHFAIAVAQVCKDIFDGKIDLKDVKTALVSAFDSGSKYASDIYQWTAKQIKT